MEKETYDLISRSLSHPIRRKILRLLNERRKMHFSDLRDLIGIDGGHLTYHLSQLGELLSKADDGSYRLSDLGTVSISLMHDVEDSGARLASAQQHMSQEPAREDKYRRLLEEYERISRSLGLSIFRDYSKTAKDELEREIQREMDYYGVPRERSMQYLYNDVFQPALAKPERRPWWRYERRFRLTFWTMMSYAFGLSLVVFFYLSDPRLGNLMLIGGGLSALAVRFLGILMDQFNMRRKAVFFSALFFQFLTVILIIAWFHFYAIEIYGIGLTSFLLIAIPTSFLISTSALLGWNLLRAYRGNRKADTREGQ